MLTKNSTNAEILAAMPELKDGKTRIFAIQQSNSGGSKVAFLCQMAVGQSSAGIGEQIFLGWTGERLVRTQQRIAAEFENKFKTGQVISADILVTERTEPAYEGQNAKVNPQTSEVLTYNGLSIYEHAALVPVGEGGVRKLERPAVNVAAAVAAQ